MARSDAVGKEPTIDELNAEAAATFKGLTTTDGVVSDGAQTAEETAALAARAAVTPPVVAAAEDGKDESAETAEDKAAREAREAKMTPEQKAAAARQAKLGGEKKANKVPFNQRMQQINDATREMRAAERALAELQKSLPNADITALRKEIADLKAAQLTPGTKAAKVVDKDAPRPADYEFGELDAAYIDAVVEYKTGKAIAQRLADQDRKAQTSTATAAQAEFEQKVSKFGTSGSKLYDDFADVVVQGARDGAWPLSATVGELLFDSEHGPDIAYYLATHVDEAKAMMAKTPTAQAAAFGRLEASFSSVSSDATAQDAEQVQAEQAPPKPAQQARTTQAPPPLPNRARAAGGKPSVSADTNDFAAFERLAMGQ